MVKHLFTEGTVTVPPNRTALCDCVLLPFLKLSLQGVQLRRGQEHYMP